MKEEKIMTRKIKAGRNIFFILIQLLIKFIISQATTPAVSVLKRLSPSVIT